MNTNRINHSSESDDTNAGGAERFFPFLLWEQNSRRGKESHYHKRSQELLRGTSAKEGDGIGRILVIEFKEEDSWKM